MAQGSPDLELLAACARFSVASHEIARLEAASVSDARFGTAVDALDGAVDTVACSAALTPDGLRAKATVCRSVLAAEEPDATTSPPGSLTLRHDVLT